MKKPIYGIVLHYPQESTQALVEAPDFLSAVLMTRTALNTAKPVSEDFVSFYRDKKEYKKQMGVSPEKSGFPFIRVSGNKIKLKTMGKTSVSVIPAWR